MSLELSEYSLIIGCNYHTKWQPDKRMRFILKSVSGETATITTRYGKKNIETNVSDLIFIMTDHNKAKAIRLTKDNNP
jgi:hypothetical protein